MKKILFVLLALALTLSLGQVYAADIPSPGIGDIMGQGKLDSAPHKIFRFVRFVPYAGSQDSPRATNDTVVIWDTTSNDGVTVTFTVTSRDPRVAGILTTAAMTPESLGNTATQDIGKRNWGWLQTYGLASGEAAPGVNLSLSAVGYAIATSKCPGMIGAFSPEVTQLGSWVGATGTGVMGFNVGVPAATPGSPLGIFLKGLD